MKGYPPTFKLRINDCTYHIPLGPRTIHKSEFGGFTADLGGKKGTKLNNKL
jgi:hypothetical protein